MPNQDNKIISEFIDFIDNHQQQEDLQSAYYQLGFICSVQALPELVELEQWLNMMSRGEQPINFEDQAQAVEYAQWILQVVEYIQVQYQQAIPLTDLHCEAWLDEQNKISNRGAEFAKGFLEAVQLFNENWLIIEDSASTQNLFQTTLLLLTKLNPPQQMPAELVTLFTDLPESDEIIAILPQLLSNLAYHAAQYISQE
ncbi:UPF0149 family protein [Psychromonas aquatilis]|uniref:UPF0149 family protein n=1 Tax=Psychromonas aquatilis TaxID=2005072 RepID=A0ABU9GN73_9GAMM